MEGEMKVYLDNNVLVDIEAGTYTVSRFLSCKDCEYCFSEAHMDDYLRFKLIESNRIAVTDVFCHFVRYCIEIDSVPHKILYK